MGVFATRSPFRPNPLGLSSVRLLGIEKTAQWGPVLHVSGADLMDNTPIFDIKPYLPYGDCRPDATGGFTDQEERELLTVDCPAALLSRLPEDRQAALLGVLANDPRPAYQHHTDRIYGLSFAGFDVRFTVEGSHLHVRALEPLPDQKEMPHDS